MSTESTERVVSAETGAIDCCFGEEGSGGDELAVLEKRSKRSPLPLQSQTPGVLRLRRRRCRTGGVMQIPEKAAEAQWDQQKSQHIEPHFSPAKTRIFMIVFTSRSVIRSVLRSEFPSIKRLSVNSALSSGVVMSPSIRLWGSV